MNGRCEEKTSTPRGGTPLDLYILSRGADLRAAMAGQLMRTTGWAAPPAGLRNFLTRFPRFFRDGEPPATVALTPTLVDQILAMRRRANEVLVFRLDPTAHGVADFWTLPDKYGDCEDWALWFLVELRLTARSSPARRRTSRQPGRPGSGRGGLLFRKP